MQFQYPDRFPGASCSSSPALPNVNLLLGSNGAGKTTILRGAALGLLAPILASSGFRPYALVRRTYDTVSGRPPRFADIETRAILSAQDAPGGNSARQQRLDVRLERIEDQDTVQECTQGTIWKPMFKDDSPAFLVLGYGATRRIGRPDEDYGARNRTTQLRYQRIQSLFEEGVSLIPLGWWLPKFDNPGRRKQVISLIDELIGDFYKFEGVVRNGELCFKRDTAHVPLGALSDGFRAFIGWVGDMLYHVCMGCPSGKKLRENEGVVLVDEIDLHLHPEWQQRVIRTLATTFPRIQFIFTSHSPLVTASLSSSNIWVMREGKPVQLLNEPIYGLSADQVLQSDYFALDSARPPEIAEKLRALEHQAQKGDRKAAVEFMKRVAYGSEKPSRALDPAVPVKAAERQRSTKANPKSSSL